MDFDIDDHTYFSSTIGNAFFSGLSMEGLWNAVCVSSTREEFDEAVQAAIKLDELINPKKE